MNLLSPTELYAGLFFLAGSGLFIAVAMGRASRMLQAEMAARVRRSIAVLDRCNDAADGRR